MNITFSPSADAILSRHGGFRDGLAAALGGLAGNCFVDGRVGRSPPDDRLVLVSPGRETVTVQYHEFEDAATVKQIAKRWSIAPAG